jgi:hypothetical protein
VETNVANNLEYLSSIIIIDILGHSSDSFDTDGIGTVLVLRFANGEQCTYLKADVQRNTPQLRRESFHECNYAYG